MNRYRTKVLAGAAVLALGVMHGGGLAVAQNQNEQAFNIPAGALDAGLRSFANQSGLDLIFASSQVAGIDTHGVSETTAPSQALKTLLYGTGLETKMSAGGAFMIVEIDDQAIAPSPIVYQTLPEPPQTQQEPSGALSSPPSEDVTLDTIVVVGSQIVGAQVDGILPVTLVDETQLDAVAGTDGDDLLRSIPQMGDVGFNSTQNVTGGVNSARGDVASINLRALGTGNTLALLNGRRMVNHPGTQSENLVPVVTVNANAIPVSGVSRIEVLLDGASALYGTDAVAGVVNTVLKTDLDETILGFRVSQEEGVDAIEYAYNLQTGQTSDDGRTNISFFASYLDRGAVFASERSFSANADLRDRLPDDWAGDTQFRNTSTNTPWGAFTLLDPATGDSVSLTGVTNSSGGFHIQPDSVTGCRVDLGGGICIDDSNSSGSIPERYNVNADRTVANAVERLNLFLTGRHEFSPEFELYGEAGFYSSNSEAERAGSAQLTAALQVIPAENYYNPFGPAGAPNRIEGIGTPDEGYDVLLRRYRLVDAGPREISVDNTVLRGLIGGRGKMFGFDWDSALLYSEAETDDTTIRTSNTLFEQALSLSTPDAYNPFNGGGLPLSAVGDATVSNSDTVSSFLVPVSRVSTTSLTLADFKLSRPDLLQIWSGDVGGAFGLEFRQEEYEDDRDDRLDGTIAFTNARTGIETSDVMGSSPTLDSSGERDVFSAFAELAVPLVSPEMNVPLAQSIDMQLAVRYEDYDLFGSVTKPKVAIAWRPFDMLLFRSAWSKGFKAPNLQQQFNRSLERVNTRTDFLTCEAQLRSGEIANFSDCNEAIAVVSRRQGSTELGPEESESFSAGLVFDATFLPEKFGKLQFTADYWSVEQEDVVGIFGDENHLIYDYLLRARGSFNPAVIRAEPTAEEIALFEGTGLEAAGQVLVVEDNYRNLLPRNVEGVDYGVYYEIDDTPLGDFNFRINIAQLLTFDQDIAPIEADILAAQANGEISEVVSVDGVGDLIRQNGRPEWRMSMSASWRKDAFGAGWYTSFVDDVFDTSASNDDTGEFWTVDSMTRHNVYVDYRFLQETDTPMRVRFGVRNIFNEEPPLADESLGYLGSLHSARGRSFYVSARTAF